MTQNLRLKLSTNTTLTSSDTDLNNTTSWTPTHTTEQFSASGGSNGHGSGSNWGSDEKADKSGFRSDNYNTNGVYYSHGSATANSARNLDGNGNEAPSSICPKGWRLPSTMISYTGGDFYNMAQYYKGNASWSGSYWSGSHNMTNTPIPNFQYSGDYYYSGSVNAIGSYGFWWSSTIYGSSNAYNMYIGSSYVTPRDLNTRLFGFNVRCILKEPKPISEITYMQDMESGTCDKMVEHQTATLTDKRDGQQYTIAKLKDGKCWMTQNLRLKLSTSKTLTSADTDLNSTSSWTPNHTTEQFSGNSGSNWGSDYKADKSGFRPDNYNTHGVYYSHGSTTANSARNLDGNGNEAPNSICPKGWRLPKTTTNSTTSDFYYMAQHYKSSASWEYNSGLSYWSGSHNMAKTPIPNFQYSGYYNYYYHYYDDYYLSSLLNIGSYGYWWSSTILSSSSAYSMYMGYNYIYPRNYITRLYGLSVRCMSR